MSNTLKEIITENIMVFTRTLTQDYRWYYSPFDKDNDSIRKVMDKMEMFSYTSSENGKHTDWKHFNGQNGTIILRKIEDGRKDMYSRPIRRIEGVFIPSVIKESMETIYPILESVLMQKQVESNNYGYGSVDEYLPRFINTTKESATPNLTKLGELYQDESGNLFAVVNGVTYPLNGELGNQLKR